jgi:DGQHR domain-containing protein
MKLQVHSFKQEGIQMYSGIISSAHLLKISDIDVWHQDGEEEIGYQRKPNPSRIGDVARYLEKDSKPLLPTSVLLSYRGKLKTQSNGNGALFIEIPDDEKLWIVDGQHRVGGLEKLIEGGRERYKDYMVPVVIVEFPSVEDEANQFRVINETMRKVPTDLARRLLAQGYAHIGGRRQLRESNAKRVWETIAVQIVKSLNQDDDSPWQGRIQGPNETKKREHVMRELSLTTSLKPILNTAPYKTYTNERLSNIIKEYWHAWKTLVPEAFEQPENYVLMKTPGIFSLHLLALHILEVLRVRGITSPTHKDFQSILEDLRDATQARFWERDNSEGAAMAGSMKGFALLADALQEELQDAGHSTE